MLRRCRCMSLPLNPKVQGGGDAYLLGFLLGVGIRSKYAEHHPKEMISAQGNQTGWRTSQRQL